MLYDIVRRPLHARLTRARVVFVINQHADICLADYDV